MTFGGGPLTPAIKTIMIICVAVFLVQNIVARSTGSYQLTEIFGLSPAAFLTSFWVWQPVTYLFLHGNLMHIVINMLVLWMFGTELERRWGTAAFVQFYFICGVGAGLTSVLLDVLMLPFSDGGSLAALRTGTIGASGAIFGLMAAQAILFPNRMLLLFFFFPMRMRPAVLLLAAMMLFTQLSAPGGSVNHVAHLGGMAFAWLYLNRVWNVRKLWLDWRWKARRRKYRVVADIQDDDRYDYH